VQRAEVAGAGSRVVRASPNTKTATPTVGMAVWRSLTGDLFLEGIPPALALLGCEPATLVPQVLCQVLTALLQCFGLRARFNLVHACERISWHLPHLLSVAFATRSPGADGHAVKRGAQRHLTVGVPGWGTLGTREGDVLDG